MKGTAASRAVAYLVPTLVLSSALMQPAASEERRVSPNVRFRMPVEYENFTYLAGRGRGRVDDRNAFTTTPEVEWAPSEAVFARLSLTLRQDFSEEERSRVYPYEGFVDVSRELWSVRLGRQVITWGRADTLRPTDVFKRHDFTDLIENREEAIDAAKVDLFVGRLTMEGVWVPVFDPDIISFRPENRWTALPKEDNVPGLGLVRVRFREQPRREPPDTLASGQGGFRISGSADGWDFAGMYYYGFDRTPTSIEQRIIAVDPLAQEETVALIPVHKRIHVLGGDFAKAIAGWGIRGEAAYTLTSDPDSKDPQVDDPYLRFTGGVDRTFSKLPLGDSLFALLQYALDTELPPQGRPNQRERSGPLLHSYRHALLLNSTWKYTEFIRVGLKGFWNLEDHDFVVQAEFSWQPMDALTIVLGTDLVGGDRDTFFGRFRDNDRIRFRLSYSF